MLRKRIIVSVISALALGLSSSALANFTNNPNAGPYIGIQGGYGDNHANDLDGLTFGLGSFDHSAVAGRAFAGYDFNQYLAVEAGYTYFQKTDIKFLGTKVGDVGTSAADVVGKISVPLVDNFGLYAKAGPGYLRSDFSDGHGTGLGNEHHFNLVYGFGADYQITPNWVADASFTRFNGHSKIDNDYQPDADLYAVGVAYKFNI